MIDDDEYTEERSRQGGYQVGYGKPPAESRFKPGRSGNPKGRPKGGKAFGTIIRDILSEKVDVRTARGSRKMPAFEAMLRTKLNHALKGDAKATEQIMKVARDVGLVRESDADPASDPNTLSVEDEEILRRGIEMATRPPDDMEP